MGDAKQLRPSPFYLRESLQFFHVGLMHSLCTQVTWQLEWSWIKARKIARVNLVDLSPPNRNQTHVINLEPLIALVKSNGCDLISHSVNDRETRGWLRTLR